jgi:hypothetical protein
MKQAFNGLVVLTMITAFMVFDASGVYAQTTAAEMLEAARARSREIEQLKAVLNGPDQNMRLATFDVMVNSEDEVMRGIAIDLGLASADPLLRGLALKETLLSLNQIVFDLEIDTSQPKPIQEHAKAILDKKGSAYRMPIAKADKGTGTFSTHTNSGGQVSGTRVVFKNYDDKGAFDLVDERTLKGTLVIYDRRGSGGFIATAKIR